MQRFQDQLSEKLQYSVGLDRFQEAVISSHFMHKLANNAELTLYDDVQFRTKSLQIDVKSVYDDLIPSMLKASNAFCGDRANAAKVRARENYRKYGLDDPRQLGIAESITEVMFDRQFLRGPRESCSRELLCRKVKELIRRGAPIEMAIPALPFKISSPLKCRGRLPDLAEVNFILELYEVAETVGLIYREAEPDALGQLAGFTVVSDGSRFHELVREPESAIQCYRTHLQLWTERLGLQNHITLLDYGSLLRAHLSAVAQDTKAAIRHSARREYKTALGPLFDPTGIAAAMRQAAEVEPDPEYSNPEGRFVALLKSLVYTINYKTLEQYARSATRHYLGLYRDLTAHIFEPYALLSPSERLTIQDEFDACGEPTPTDKVKEYLRQSMLCEAWSAAIDYIAEIKSDRDLEQDPITTCLPDHFRWTIHAKSGQLAILTPMIMGTPVQAWAGAAVFKSTKKNKVRLYTLPVLALEGAGAIPVMVRGTDRPLPAAGQPLFYIHPDLQVATVDGLLSIVRNSLVRNRAS
jgi:hypothetical protein